MPRSPLSLPDAELAVLRCLWEHGIASARQLTEWLYPEGTAAQVATVQKLLTRLEEKHCVRRDRDHWPHQFSAAVDRHDVILDQLQQTAERLCDGELHPLLTHLVKAGGLNANERQSLRALLDDLDQPGTRSRK
jgi:BlaI family transcriptional regulator, penicillinase repressor